MNELAASLETEIAAEAVRRDAHIAEDARHRGVAWSACAPAPYDAIPLETLTRRAQAVTHARNAWRTTAPARFIKAVAEGQRTAGLAHQACERARAAWSRDFAGETPFCLGVAAELEGLALSLLRSARRARRAARASLPPGHADDAKTSSRAAARE